MKPDSIYIDPEEWILKELKKMMNWFKTFDKNYPFIVIVMLAIVW